MIWGSLISTILPTIGTVIGKLIGVKSIEDGVIHFSHQNLRGAQQGFSSQIYCENGEYYLFNQSTSSDDVVTMTFPARGQTGAESVMVPGRQSFNVTPFFSENAAHDNSKFELTACAASQNVQGIGDEQQSGIKISASGYGIPVGGQKQSIGSYIDVKVDEQQITVYPKAGLQLQNLPLLTVCGSGDTDMRVNDVNGEPQAMVVQLPQPLQPQDQVRVDVVANVQPTISLMELPGRKKYAHLFTEVDDDTAERIRKAPKLNWGEIK